MSCDEVPKPKTSFFIHKDHIFDVKDFFCNPVNHITRGFIVFIIVDGSDDVIGVPKPIFVPSQFISDECAVGLHGVLMIGLFKHLTGDFSSSDIAGHRLSFRQLIVVNLIDDFIRDEFPPFVAIIGNRIRIQIRDVLFAVSHVIKGLK